MQLCRNKVTHIDVLTKNMETLRTANEPWTPEQLELPNTDIEPVDVNDQAFVWLYHSFLHSLTVFDYETVGRVSFLEGRLRPHFILAGEREWVPPEVVEEVQRGQAHYYFHTHPRGPLTNCWPSVEDLVDAAMKLCFHPRLRAEIIATACGLVIIERHMPTFTQWTLLRDPMKWQFRLYRHFTKHASRHWQRNEVATDARIYGLAVRFLTTTGVNDTSGDTIQYTVNTQWLGGLKAAMQEKDTHNETTQKM